MSRGGKSGALDRDLTDDAVERYLEKRLDFFEYRPELLAQLRIPHHIKGAVSLVERQVGLLRNKNGKLKGKLVELVQLAWENEGLSNCCHQLALKLLEAKGLVDVLVATKSLLRREFPATYVAIHLLDNGTWRSDSHALGCEKLDLEGAELFAELFTNRRPVCGLFSNQQMALMFGECEETIASAVLIPLQCGQCFGIMALGAEQMGHFREDMDTLFLHYLGDLLSCALKVHQ